jgi:hypothetical protein
MKVVEEVIPIPEIGVEVTETLTTDKIQEVLEILITIQTEGVLKTQMAQIVEATEIIATQMIEEAMKTPMTDNPLAAIEVLAMDPTVEEEEASGTQLSAVEEVDLNPKWMNSNPSSV